MKFLRLFPHLRRVLFCVNLFIGSIAIAAVSLMFYIILVAELAVELIELRERYFIGFSVYKAPFEWIGLALAIYLLPCVTFKRISHLCVYLYLKLIFLMVLFSLMVISFISGNHWIDDLPVSITWMVEIYFWLCINSYYLSLMEVLE